MDDDGSGEVEFEEFCVLMDKFMGQKVRRGNRTFSSVNIITAHCSPALLVLLCRALDTEGAALDTGH